MIEKTLYNNFKSYSYYQEINRLQEQHQKEKEQKTFKAIGGAALGVAGAMFLYPKIKNKFLDKGIDTFSKNFYSSLEEKGNKNLAQNLKKLKLKETVLEVAEMLSMAGAANVGAVTISSIGEEKEKVAKKWKEAGFQIMNTSIPMLMVTAAIKICEGVKQLNKIPIKIIASFAAMSTGAMLATKITNLGKENNEPKRKYTIKDSVANFDDIVATIAIGFPEVAAKIPVKQALPFIYAYCGHRAGKKE